MAVLDTYANIATADGTEEFVVIHAAATKNITSSVLRTYTLGNAFVAFTGPATATKTFTLPNATDTIACLGQAQTFTAAQTFNAAVNLGTAATLTLNGSTQYAIANPQSGTAGTQTLAQMHATSVANSGWTLGNWNSNVAQSGSINFAKSISGTLGLHTAVTDGASLGTIMFQGSDGDEFLRSAAIEAVAADTATNGLAKGKINFLVTDRTGTLKVGAVVTEWGQLRVAANSFSGPALSDTVAAKFFIPAATYTDNASSGSPTIGTGIVAGIGSVTIAGTNATTTYTNAVSFYIAGGPTQGTNVTLTNRWALYSAANINGLVGNTRIGGTAVPTNALSVTGSVDVSADLTATGYLSAEGAPTPGFQLAALSGDRTVTESATTAIDWFPSSENEFTTVANSTYLCEGIITVVAGITSSVKKILFAGNAAVSSIRYYVDVFSGGTTGDTEQVGPLGTAAGNYGGSINTAAETSMVLTTPTGSTFSVFIRGMVRFTTSGTFIPQFKYDSDTGAGNQYVIKTNTFFLMQRVGSNSVVKTGSWN